jgi:hypothetical protein
MTRHAICRIGFVVAGLSAYPTPASAHRLDEYLQATRLDIGADQIRLDISLTPGASIAAQIAAQIDTNRDGRLSSDERRRYAQTVVSSIVVSIDGRMTPVALATEEFPTLEAMAAGTGTIRLRAAANVSTGSGRHRVMYRSGQLSAFSVYLVNALIPTDARVQLAAPHRDPVQRELAIDFSVAPDTATLRAAWMAIAFSLLGMLVALRHARSRGQRCSRTRRALSNA